MIKGTECWKERSAYFSQSNNPTETFLKTTLKDRAGWLVSCGPTVSVGCLAVMGKNVEIACPGVYKPQPEEVLMDYFNDPRNKKTLNSIRFVADAITKNRVPQYYPHAVYAVFGHRSNFRWGMSFMSIAAYVGKGCAVQVCLKVPDHYVGIIAYDDEKYELLYNDPWGERFPDKRGGWQRRMGQREFEDNVQNFFIVYEV